VKLVIVHYHLRPGGIRRVIELATPHLVQQFGKVESVTLACGEANDEKWNQNFTRLDRTDRSWTWLIEPALGYFSEQKKSPEKIRAELKPRWQQLLPAAEAANSSGRTTSASVAISCSRANWPAPAPRAASR
jgi:hypothetical protein